MTARFSFRHHVIDTKLPVTNYAQTALFDLDNDGQLEFVVGQQYGNVYWYKYHEPGRWSRHLLGVNSPSDVGAFALDVDADGWVDLVTGGAWYRNSRDPNVPFTRFAFDPDLTSVHDVVAGDIDGDGRAEVITMSDQNSLRWYEIPDDPTRPWGRQHIGPPVHAGASLGDISGNGALDIVRTDVPGFRTSTAMAAGGSSIPSAQTPRRRQTSAPISPLMPPTALSVT